MSLARIQASAIHGIEAIMVDVEVHVRPGIPKFTIIGLGDSAVREARDRVQSALKRSGFELPDQILVNLAPAELKKEGSSFDLPIALGILVASKQIDGDKILGNAFCGELSLDGQLKPVRGIIAHATQAMRHNVKQFVVPQDHIQDLAALSELSYVGLRSLSDVVSYLRGEEVYRPEVETIRLQEKRFTKSLSEVRGQEQAIRALTVAAAGRHNVLFIGAPGAGKSMLAERFTNLLSPLTKEELLEVLHIHSIAGLSLEPYLQRERPYRHPHHSISEAGLIGGASTQRPGEMSLAHRGVLFLDEFPEFKRNVIEALREPLEVGSLKIARARGVIEFPAQFQMIVAMNPCPCGRLGLEEDSCLCSPRMVQQYLKKLSQPILDRIDLHLELQPVPIKEIAQTDKKIDRSLDERLREQVIRAQERALERSGKPNAELTNQEIYESLSAKQDTLNLLEQVADKRRLSARAFFRLLKVVRTIADLEESEQVNDSHVVEAAGYRAMDLLHNQYSEAA